MLFTFYILTFYFDLRQSKNVDKGELHRYRMSGINGSSQGTGSGGIGGNGSVSQEGRSASGTPTTREAH